MLVPILAATALTAAIALLLAFTARLNAILPKNRPPPTRRRGLSLHVRRPSQTIPRRLDRATRDSTLPASKDYPYGHITIVLGSGGHTAEILLMLEQARLCRWRKRTWVVSSGDGFSAGLAGEFEERLRENTVNGKGTGDFEIVALPRARRVHQSILTAPWTSLLCLWAAIKVLTNDAPDIILTNGPGTGVILILASLILRFFAVGGSNQTRCIYIESLARCRKLSLSGRLLKPVVDRFLVQWPELEEGRARFRGCFALEAAVGVGLEGVGEPIDNGKGWITYDL